MKTNLTSIGTAAVAAAMLFAGSAHAQEPVDKTAPDKSAGPSLDVSGARVSQYADEHGALGSYFDPDTRSFVVVAPSGSKLDAPKLDVPTRVEERAIAQSTVDALQERIAKQAAGDAKRYSYASYLDLRTGKLILKTDAPRTVTAALSKGYAGVIEQQEEAVHDDFSRKSDIAPFWGGNSIKSGGGICSSSFVVKKPSGTRFLATAGHCFTLGANVTTTNSNVSVGSVTERGPIPPFDMELIGGKSYGSHIFVGGVDSSSSKHVAGSGDPVVGFTNYCRSGQTTGEQCSQTVSSVNAQVCTQTGCKSPVISYTGPASAPGDSGAPFYVYTGDGSAVHARGMHIAAGSTTSFAEKWSRISSHLGVSIVT